MLSRILSLTLLFSYLSEKAYSKSEIVQNSKKELIQQLYHLGAIKLERITLKSGVVSPIYFDLRMIISDPQTLKLTAEIIADHLKDYSFDMLCAVPYAAVPITTAIALAGDHRMIMQRKEAKSYGTKKLIEGRYAPGDRCLVIEDVITTGGSIGETIQVLENHGLTIPAIFVIIDRQQGGIAHLEKKGYTVHALFTLEEIAQTLLDQGYLTKNQFDELMK